MSQTIDPQLQSMIDNLPEKTGKTLQEWFSVLDDSGLEKHGDIIKKLKGEYGVTHGYANTVTLLYRQHASGVSTSDEDLVESYFSGGKSVMRPVFDILISTAKRFGSDVEIAPKKTYVSLRRNKQFAIVQVSTKDRIDLGLNLKGVDPGGRLEGGNVFSGMCTHKVRINTPEDVDPQVIAWLEHAYNLS